MMDLLLSIDVEEWFQVENLKSAVDKNQWHKFESRVVKNTENILDILENFNQKATFFILGWIAEKLPNLVKEISSRGHEIASHGFDHEPVYNLSKEQFKKDLIKSKEILEKCSNQEVIGFRAPTFSMTAWGLDILKDLNFVYDSSYQPHRAAEDFPFAEQKSLMKQNILRLENGIFEVLLASRKVVGVSVPWSGGGYFRLIPISIFKSGVKRILQESSSYCFYIHPWEFDPEQPKIHIPFMKRFKHYHALAKTEMKFRALLKEFKFKPIKEALPLKK